MRKMHKVSKLLSDAGIQNVLMPSDDKQQIDDGIIISNAISLSIGRIISVTVKVDEERYKVIPAELHNVVGIVMRELEKSVEESHPAGWEDPMAIGMPGEDDEWREIEQANRTTK